MGNVSSDLGEGFATNNPLNPIATVPVQDGASGLHYSGRVYANQMQTLAADICKGATLGSGRITDIMPAGISTYNLPRDPATNRIATASLRSYINSLTANKSPPNIPGKLGNFDEQMAADKQFYAATQAEYCFYEVRYKAALSTFLGLVADQQNPDKQAISIALAQASMLNARLNSLLEIINYVGNDRATHVNTRSHSINTANGAIQEKIKLLKAQHDYIESSDVTIRTQEEMIRYSAEKSRAMNIQIIFFVALNVVALGTIITVYKSIKPTV